MTPTLVIDRTFKGCGRVKVRTGTKLPAVRRKMSRMLTALADEGRVDMLRAVRDGRIHIMALFDAYNRKALESLPSAETAKPLGATMLAWIETMPGEARAKSHRMSRRYLVAARPSALVSDLPDVLEQLRPTLGTRAPRSFNMLRVNASAFVRAQLKRNHPLYAAVLAVEPVTVKKLVRHHPLTVAEMHSWFPSPSADPVDAIAWGMATTGMGPKEYFGRWSVMLDRIHVAGTKREARVRDIPLMQTPAVPTIARQTFEGRFRTRMTDAGITPYDLRRTFANWMEQAGIIRTRRKLYMGHSAGDITGGYELHEVSAFLADDGAKLRAFAGMDGAPGLRLEKAISR